MIAPSPGMSVTRGVTLVRHLGAGAMGSVWLADHAALGTQVVVKFMARALQLDEPSVARFAREAAAASQVKSPHVVQMLDHGATPDGQPFIIMEHLEGQDLGTYLTIVGRVEPRMALSIVTQVARALGRAHERGVIHRDIKPDNIFLTETGDGDPFVKVLDFGVAKTMSVPKMKITATGVAVGTPYYMSPEQIVGARDLDHRADLWALAVVTFEMLTGVVPFQCETSAALLDAVARGAFAPITAFAPRLPRAVDEWFRKACHRDPEQRFANARELAAALAAAFANTTQPGGSVVVAPAGVPSPGAFDVTQPMTERGPRGPGHTATLEDLEPPATEEGHRHTATLEDAPPRHASPLTDSVAATTSERPRAVAARRAPPSTLARVVVVAMIAGSALLALFVVRRRLATANPRPVPVAAATAETPGAEATSSAAPSAAAAAPAPDAGAGVGAAVSSTEAASAKGAAPPARITHGKPAKAAGPHPAPAPTGYDDIQ